MWKRYVAQRHPLKSHYMEPTSTLRSICTQRCCWKQAIQNSCWNQKSCDSTSVGIVKMKMVIQVGIRTSFLSYWQRRLCSCDIQGAGPWRPSLRSSSAETTCTSLPFRRVPPRHAKKRSHRVHKSVRKEAACEATCDCIINSLGSLREVRVCASTQKHQMFPCTTSALGYRSLMLCNTAH